MSNIQPLRVQKATPSSSPQKSALSEISPSAVRRNSPSANAIKKQLLDSSAFDTSPFAAKFAPFTQNDSPHLYWQQRESPSPTRGIENNDPEDDSQVASKRPSVENLKRASRVSKSNIFALEQKQEYDPTTAPQVERPLAPGRALLTGMPLGLQARNSILDHNRFFEKKRPNGAVDEVGRPISPTRQQTMIVPEDAISPNGSLRSSPTKSAMSQNPRFSLYDPETSIWSEADEYEERKLPPGKSLHRRGKSVTFNQSPPEVKEYEQPTPDPSVGTNSREGSYEEESEEEDFGLEQQERDSSQDSFDESLEDTDKTPVVLPGDWRHMSPEAANKKPVANMEDPFGKDEANHQLASANAAFNAKMMPARTESLNSDGSRRPLPPLPPPSIPQERAQSTDSFEAVAERAATSPRSLPSPPRAAGISKDELRSFGASSMSLEQRLSLMSVQEQGQNETSRRPQDETRERRLRRKSGLHNSVTEREIKIFEDAPEEKDEQEDVLGEAIEFSSMPRISRDSILRKVKSQHFEEYKSPSPEPEQEQSFADAPLPQLNPDEPIRSYEESPSFLEGDDQIEIKQEEDESILDINEVPLHTAVANGNSQDLAADVLEAQEDDAASQYSTDSLVDQKAAVVDEPEEPPTPRAAKPLLSLQGLQNDDANRMSLSGFGSLMTDDFGLSMSSYMTPSPYNSMTESHKKIDVSADTADAGLLPRPQTPELARVPGYSDEELLEPSTPESVIRRSASVSSAGTAQEEVPEPVATIKAPGTKMKTRTSLTPRDVRAMAETRRQVSGGEPPVPAIPPRQANRPSMIAEADSFLDEPELEGVDTDASKQSKRNSELLQLDLSVDEQVGELSFGLDKEFDRVIEAQKKGYMMRQNTKLVVASSRNNTTTTSDDAAVPGKPSLEAPGGRDTRSANSSPVKKSRNEMSGAWQTHEWNGKVRRKSIRQSGGLPSEVAMSGAVPPLPGMPSAVGSMESLDEAEESDSDNVDGSERGRLFVRVVGAKDLSLPLPRNERSHFALMLDNGMHCVTTSWLDLSKNPSIGQEFELVVLNDLEFQLTLQTKIEQPKPVARPESPTKFSSPLKKPGFSRFFGSPKKKKEQEMKAEQERQAAERQRTQARTQPTAWDLLHNIVGKDGSFARSYISLKEHETKAYGRPYTVDIPCFNEWAVESVPTISSTKGGRTAGGVQRKAPYKVGKLELQLLYIPKPKDAKDEDMPKSMNACVREMQEAEKVTNQAHEGFLSQQGGDCPYWRRRFFRLSGNKLTAFHESTRQPRATINLAKAIKLIDDKSNLKQQVTAKSGSRRKSAFGSEEEGYMFLEEGFRVRFANGETIDFYADTVALKDGWMAALADTVTRASDSRQTSRWTDLVLKRERANGAKVNTTPSQRGRAHAAAASSTSGGIVPGPRDSSKPDTGKRPSSSQGRDATTGASAAAKPANLRAGEVMGPPAVPSKGRPSLTPAERRAKARSTYY